MSGREDRLMMYWPNLIGKARATLPYADPVVWEDAAAATLEAACRQLGADDRDPLPWLLTTVKRRAIDDIDRAEYRHTQHSGGVGRARVDAGSDAHLTALIVRDALDRLPPFLAAYASGRLDGFGILEAGARVGMPRSTASRREDELRAQLRVLLGGAV